MAIITKELADKIVDKFKAVVDRNGAHPMAYVYHNGVLVTSFGLRHGSSKSQGYDHIPKQIHLTTGKAKRFGQCHMKVDEWVEEMMEKGVIARPAPAIPPASNPDQPAKPPAAVEQAATPAPTASPHAGTGGVG